MENEIKTEVVAPIAGKGGAWYAYVPGGLGAYGPTKESAIKALKDKIERKNEAEAGGAI